MRQPLLAVTLLILVLLVTSCDGGTNPSGPDSNSTPLSQRTITQSGNIGSQDDPGATRPTGPNAYCDKASGQAQSQQPPLPFLYLPFDGQLTEGNWTSQIDHETPNYSHNGLISTLGETMRQDRNAPGLAGGTEALSGSGSKKQFPYDTPYTSVVSQGYHILAYQSPSFESYFYYDGHDGHDFAVAGNALAAADGKVAFMDNYGNTFGRVVEIYHPQGYLTRYAHLASYKDGLSVGDVVQAGDIIGKIGGSAVVKGAVKDGYWGIHLHFSLFRWNDGLKSWRITDPFGWDPWAGLDLNSRLRAQRADPLVQCNGEVSYPLWVGDWPQSAPGVGLSSSGPFRPTKDRYVGGWLGDTSDYIALQSPQPQITQPPLNRATTVAIAAATALADTNGPILAQAQEAINDGDFYIAAALLRSILSSEPSNSQATQFLSQISSKVPGGIVTNGNPPSYHPFAAPSAIPFPNWPHNANDLIAISLDGKRGYLSVRYNNVASFAIDFATGALVDRRDFRASLLSPDLSKVIKPNPQGGIRSGSQKIVDMETQTGVEVAEECAPWNSRWSWTRDGTKLVALDGNRARIGIVDVSTGACHNVSLPGVGWGNAVALAPDGEHLWIVTPGSSTWLNQGRFMIADANGTGIKKLTDLPIMDANEGPISISPDGTTAYLTDRYGKAYVVSIKTGRTASMVAGGMEWIDQAPPQAVARQPILSVTPQSGTRLTRFSFSFSDGPPGQEIKWGVSRSSDPEGAPRNKRADLDTNGNLSDAQGEFGMDTDINTEAGTYYVRVYVQDNLVATATFEVTE